MSSNNAYAVESGNQQLSAMNNSSVSVLEEELQEKGAMFRDFLTSRVSMISSSEFKCFTHNSLLGGLGR